jgi:hypothetical protein
MSEPKKIFIRRKPQTEYPTTKNVYENDSVLPDSHDDTSQAEQSTVS